MGSGTPDDTPISCEIDVAPATRDELPQVNITKPFVRQNFSECKRNVQMAQLSKIEMAHSCVR